MSGMRKWILYIVLGLVVLLIIISAVAALHKHSETSGTRNISDTFVTDVLNNKADESYALFTPQTQGTISQSDWNSQVQQLSTFFQGQTPSYQSTTSSSNNLSLVTYTIKGSDGNYAFALLVQKNGSSWNVQSFTSKLQ